MLLPPVGIKRGTVRTRLAGLFLRGTPAKRLMNTAVVVIEAERLQLPLQVERIPE